MRFRPLLPARRIAFHPRRANGDSNILLALSDGTFTRSSSGSFYNGSTSSIAMVGPDILRMEDRGDGYGSQALIEGSRTNVAIQSEDFGDAAWAKSVCSVTASMFLSPNASPAFVTNFGANASARLVQSSLAGWTADHHVSGVLSCFLRSSGSSDAARLSDITKANTRLASPEFSLSQNWGRFDFATTNQSGATNANAEVLNRTGNVTASVGTWGFQLEVSASFPSSYISTSNGSATRAADVLTFSSYPDAIRTIGFEIDFWPSFTMRIGQRRRRRIERLLHASINRR
jgi:hypothetical protein